MLFGEHINDLDFVADVVSHILWVADDIRHRIVRELVTARVANALVVEVGLKVLHTVLAGGIQLEQLLDYLCLFLVNIQPLVCFAVAEDVTVAEHYSVLDRLVMSPLNA